MSLEPQIQLLNKLGNLGSSIPGLNIDPIIENLVEKSEELKTITESIDSEEEEENERETRSEKRKERKDEKERKKAGKTEKTEQEKEAKKAEREKKREEFKKKAEEKKKKIIEDYKKNIRKTVQEEIDIIKQNYKVFKDAIESIPPDVSALIANIFLPPGITAPPGVFNPIYAYNIAKQGKNTLGRTLNSSIVAFSQVLKAATAIKFQIPKSILDLFDKISAVNSVISSIPLG
jgi:hypothetical protein